MENISLANIFTLVQETKKLSQNKRTVLIAIDGVGGSGKTTLASLLKRELQDSVVIQLDDFYSPTLQMTDLLRLKDQVLLPLHNHRDLKYQIYQWKTDDFSDWHVMKPDGIFIFEGVYALDKTILDYYDLKIWVEYPAELGFQRGIARDIEQYGVDNADKWKNVWMPLEEKYKNEQEPIKSANYIFDGTELLL